MFFSSEVKASGEMLPFSISEATMMAQYDAIYDLQALQTLDVSGGLNGSVPATETAWLLTGKGS